MSGSLAGEVRFRDVKTWVVQLVLKGHTGTGLSFPFSPIPLDHSEADDSTPSVISVDHNPRESVLATSACNGLTRICKFSLGSDTLDLVADRCAY